MKNILTNKRGEGYVDTGVKIIIAIVIGALILGGLYLIFAGDGGIIDNLNGEVEAMMDYTQELRYERYLNEENNTYTIRYSYDGKHWKYSEMPSMSDTATVYKVMSNNSETNPIEAALIQDGTTYHIITSKDGGITWNTKLTFTGTSISHCYYGTSSSLPTGSASFSGQQFVIRVCKGGSSYFTITSDGETWEMPTWSDLRPLD